MDVAVDQRLRPDTPSPETVTEALRRRNGQEAGRPAAGPTTAAGRRAPTVHVRPASMQVEHRRPAWPAAVSLCHQHRVRKAQGGSDVLRDEGEAYAADLRRVGVPVTAVRYQGIVHDFVMVNSLHDTQAAKAAVAQAVAASPERYGP